MGKIKFIRKYFVVERPKNTNMNWQQEKFLTGGKNFDKFSEGMKVVKKLRSMSSSIDYKLKPVDVVRVQ